MVVLFLSLSWKAERWTRAGLSQKDLAALVHVSNDVISKIETGERPPAEDFPPRLDADTQL